jgi:hypothetical protein
MWELGLETDVGIDGGAVSLENAKAANLRLRFFFCFQVTS